MRTISFSAFTLVELIVVITIVSILSTIGFVSYVDYLKGVRDSSRLQQISEIHGSMELYATRSALPFPDENISIVAGSTQVGYQGVAGSSVLDAIRFSNGGKDPGSKKYFIYYLSADRKYAQLLAFFEEQQAGNLLSYESAFAQYDTLYPQVYGSELGLLLEQGSNIPVHELSQYTSSGKLDILTITQPVISYLTNTEQITGTGQSLIGMIPNTSCKKLQELYGYASSGFYKINPSGTRIRDVYCDMTTDGGGWTMIARSVKEYLGDDTMFGWLIERGDIYNDMEPYSFGVDSKNILFNEIMWGSYFENKNILLANSGIPAPNVTATKLVVDRGILLRDEAGAIDALSGCVSSIDVKCGPERWHATRFFGNITDTGSYNQGSYTGWWRETSLNYRTFGWPNVSPGMVFVR